jgi:hypothetical protein
MFSPLRRLLARQSDDNALNALADRTAVLEEENSLLRDQTAVLWALAPTWITEPIPHARAHGWNVRATCAAIHFEHPGRRDEYPIRLPLPVDPTEHVRMQRDLHMRLDYSGPTGLEGLKEPVTVRPRIVDLPERRFA